MTAIAFVVFTVVFQKQSQTCPQVTNVIQKGFQFSYNGKVRNASSAFVSNPVQGTYVHASCAPLNSPRLLVVTPGRTCIDEETTQTHEVTYPEAGWPSTLLL